MEETSLKALDASVPGCIPGYSLLAIIFPRPTFEPQSYWYIFADDIVYRLLSLWCRIDMMCKSGGTSVGV